MTQGTNGCMRGDEAEEVPRAYYFTVKPVSTKSVQDILEEAAKTTKSNLQLTLERTIHCERGESKSVSDSLKGTFYKIGCSAISFTVPPACEGDMFEGIEFSAFDLQEFDEDNELSKYTKSLIRAIDEAYKKVLSQK